MIIGLYCPTCKCYVGNIEKCAGMIIFICSACGKQTLIKDTWTRKNETR